MSIPVKPLLTIIASAAVISCFPACAAESVPIDGGTTDGSDHHAPKTIHSKNITSFAFYAENMDEVFSVKSKGGNNVTVDKTDGFPPNLDGCRFNLEKHGAKADFMVTCRNGSAGTFKATGTTNPSALVRLQDIMDRYKVAQLNGFYKRNSALGSSFSLKVSYDSGEQITAGAEGGAATEPDSYLPKKEFNAFFRQLVEKSGQKIPGALPPISTLTGFNIRFTNFHAAPSFPKGRYHLGYYDHGSVNDAYLEYGTDKSSMQYLFSQKITQQQVAQLKALIEKNRLVNLSGYNLKRPAKGDHQFEWNLSYQDRTGLNAEAIGDESVLPAKYWDDNGKSYVIFFRKLMQQYGKKFPLK